ncbi:MAG: DinB family protein [Anaerolineae bacterium]|nr:DinB family protein [Anaerolineae bacterium]
MNSLTQMFDILHMTVKLRDLLLEASSEEDLAYRLPGDNPTLGELFRELGETEQSYIDGFKNFKHDFDYRHPDPTIARNKAKLAEWYTALDAELEAVVEALPEEDIQTKTIVRPYWEAPVTIMFHTYRECYLIFGGKASVYFRALKKPLPEQVMWWIG